MSLTQKLMRFLSPECEKQRMEFRHELAKVEAHAEDLMRTMRFTPQQVQEWTQKPTSKT